MTINHISIQEVVLFMSNTGNLLPPLEWIRVFEAAGRTGSFTAAAQETGLTQAAVSQRIRNLEGVIGTHLFNRNPRGVTLTVDGEAWLPYVANALETLRRSAEELFEKPLKKITISASTSVIQLWIAPRLRAFTSKTNYQVALHTMNTEPDFEKVTAEVEIKYGLGSWEGRRSAKLFDEVLAPLACPNLAKPGETSWQNLPRIAISGPRPGWQEWARQVAGVSSPIPALRFDSLALAMSAAKSGAGVMLGSLPLCQESIADGSLVRLSSKTIEQTAGYWITSKHSMLPQKQWNHLVECFCQ